VRHRPSAEIIAGFDNQLELFLMAKIIRTEADRLATPRPAAPKGVCYTAPHGQLRSLERGAATNNKKNPGKRCKKGG
jgi:hypothetical protein